ncbi:conserved hypothetical protein [delta proteobacterium NaphS2]|nr:conserved hypothetical protein [delta proteobacterium NaphS2]
MVEEPLEGKMQGTSRPESVSTRFQRIAKLSREVPEMVWTTLAHHIDIDLLREAYRLTRKDGAVGVDGQTAKAYSENLEENLRDLLNRFKSGDYKAPPVRRTYVPKGDGKRTRPIGIPTVASYCTSYRYSLGMMRALFVYFGGVLDPLRQFFFLTGAQGNPVRRYGA